MHSCKGYSSSTCCVPSAVSGNIRGHNRNDLCPLRVGDREGAELKATLYHALGGHPRRLRKGARLGSPRRAEDGPCGGQGSCGHWNEDSREGEKAKPLSGHGVPGGGRGGGSPCDMGTAPRAPSEEDGEAAGGQRTVTVTPESPCICTLAVADRHARQPGGGNDPSVHWWVNGTHGGVRPHRGTLFRLEKEGHPGAGHGGTTRTSC